MLKKLMYLMMASTAMLFATSCEKDVEVAPTSVVTFNVGSPELVSRAYSDGMTATVLQYAVYDETGAELTALTKKDATINGSTTVNLQLTTGNTYSVIFWAAAPNAPYTVDFATKTMTVDYSAAVSNDENRDAFYKYHTFTVTGAQTETIELKRPFAQLNIGTSDYTAAKNAGYEPKYSSVTVKQIYTTLKMDDGTVATPVDVTFDYAAIPTAETFPVSGYEYLAMNYLLVDAEKELVDIEFGYTETDATAAKTRTVGSVPVQRNHRTNIYGKLFTSSVDINIEINPEYEDPDYNIYNVNVNGVAYTNFAEAVTAAMDQNKAIELIENVVVDADNTITIPTGKTLTINLNGYTLSGVTDQTGSNREMFLVKGTLNVNGANTMTRAAAEGSGCITIKHVGTNMSWNSMTTIFDVTDGGVLNIENTNAINFGGSDMAFVAHLNNWGEVTLNVENSTMESKNYVAVRVFNSGYDMNNVTIKNSTLKGGTYAFWVHNYTAADHGTQDKADAQKALLNFDIFNGTNTFIGKNDTPIRFGMTDSVYANAEGEILTKVPATETGDATNLDGKFIEDAVKSGVETIVLEAGEYVVNLYNLGDVKTLKIVGTNGTKLAFDNLQVRASQFENLTISNCEIMRMPNKSWGHLVFGSSDNANGVYTISNCTFNGVGTQGIYINEMVSGVTYNIENCTFNGDFGSEGAITIQTNKDVNHTVNVMGCTFNDIPDTSHRIYLAKNGEGSFYYGWTLNTDLKAYTAYDIATFVALGHTEINLADGEYDVYGCGGKTLTINGSKNAVIKLYNDGEEGCDYAFGGNGTGVGDYTFNGITIDTQANTGNYKGFAYMKGTFNNCNFVGAYSLNNANDFVFNKCTFDFKNGYFWTWGAKSVTFDGCIFNGNSKNILAHGYASTIITIKDCKFEATEKGYTGAGDWTAAVEIDPAGTNTYTINFTGVNTKSDKYAGWTRVKDGSTGHTITGIE